MSMPDNNDVNAMAKLLFDVKTAEECGRLHEAWIGYDPIAEGSGESFTTIRGVLADYVRELAYACGFQCPPLPEEV